MSAPGRWRRRLGLGALVLCAAAAARLAHTKVSRSAEQAGSSPAAPIHVDGVAALGRLQPKDGVIRVAGPSRSTAVIGHLLVEEGQSLHVGDVIAILDAVDADEASVAELEADLRNARAELARNENLLRAGSATGSQRDALQLKVDVTASRLRAARAALETDRVRSPINGRVLVVHAHTGERVGPNGIVEIGQTDQMYALAEVYETDVPRVHVGQSATIRSRALPHDLGGTVERIGLKVGRLDVQSSDPTADTDARVVNVLVRLDEANAAALTNLQVEVIIHPDAATRP